MKTHNSIIDFYKNNFVVDNYIQRRFKGIGGEFVNHTELKLMLQNLPSNLNDKTIMDLGAGTGRLTLEILKLKPKQIIAVDPSKEMLSRLRKIKNKFFTAKLGKAEKLPFENEVFDIVTSLRLFEHLENETFVRSLNEINRVLKPNGLLIINTVNKFSLEGLFIKIFGYSSSPVFPTYNPEIVQIIKNTGYHYYKKNDYAFVLPRGLFLHLHAPVARLLIFLEKLLIKTPLRIFSSHTVWYLQKLN